MSAICGVYHLDNRPVLKETGHLMMDKIKMSYDHLSNIWFGEYIFFGCLFQNVTPESKYEILPITDEDLSITITADAIIDNRTELLKYFNLPEATWSKTPDSQLILLSYKRWGEKCPQHLIGDFVFVIWDASRKELFCARDHVGKRTLYYHLSPSMFAFSTLMMPLCEIPEIGNQLNNTWIADFLTIPNVAHEFDCTHTIYKNISQLPPAHFMVITSSNTRIQKYWNPLDIPKLNLKSNEDYEKAFREVFFEAVKCRTRSIGDVGVMLSGGLDSGSVSCVAAKELKKSGKSLKAYSAIPMKGYENWLPARFIADESPYIEAIKEFNGNIDVIYSSFEGKDSLSDVDKLLKLLEQPYKIVENLFWLDDIAEIASKEGCKVLLDGQFGNSTISYGSFVTNSYSLCKQFKFRLLYKEIIAYSRINKIRPLKIQYKLVRKFLPYHIQVALYKVHNKNAKKRSTSPVNTHFSKKYNVIKRLKKAGFDELPLRISDFRKTRELLIHPAAFSHLGALETKLSLAYGIAKRDPTRDKRVIEFCMSLPFEQYVQNGQERSLIRRSMSGILPDKIRLNSSIKGRQSADWVQRLLPNWDEILQKLKEIIEDKDLKQYIDTSIIEEALKDFNETPPKSKQAPIIRMLLIVIIFGKFLKNQSTT